MDREILLGRNFRLDIPPPLVPVSFGFGIALPQRWLACQRVRRTTGFSNAPKIPRARCNNNFRKIILARRWNGHSTCHSRKIKLVRGKIRPRRHSTLAILFWLNLRRWSAPRCWITVSKRKRRSLIRHTLWLRWKIWRFDVWKKWSESNESNSQKGYFRNEIRIA